MDPILKWVGGKRSILPELDKHLPIEINDYYEPFVGGAAVFCRVQDRIQCRAHLSDLNGHLIRFYDTLAEWPNEVVEEYETLLMLHGRDAFYGVRDDFNGADREDVGFDPAVEAAQFLYLNTAGFNGLWRVNKKGRCNVPFGGQRKLKDPGVVREFAEQIKGVSLGCHSYDDPVMGRPTFGDLVYCDPPYTGTFEDYTKQGWCGADDVKLRDLCLKWRDDGARVVVTVADPIIWMGDFEVHEVQSASKIKSKPRVEYIVTGG